jgi:hypothetical protein
MISCNVKNILPYKRQGASERNAQSEVSQFVGCTLQVLVPLVGCNCPIF